MLNNFRLLTKEETLYGEEYDATRLSMFNRADYTHAIWSLECSALDFVYKFAPNPIYYPKHIYRSGGKSKLTYQWALSFDKKDDAYSCIRDDGKEGYIWNDKYYGVRPAVEYSKIKPYVKDHGFDRNDNKLVTFGEWASNMLDGDDVKVLEKLRVAGKMKEVGSYKIRITSEKIFAPVIYEYNGKRYAYAYTSKLFKDVPYWSDVKPVVWLVDEEKNVAVTEECIFATTKEALKKTEKYLNEEFSKDLLQGTEYADTQIGDAYGLREVEEELEAIRSKKEEYEGYPIVMQYGELIRDSMALCNIASSEEEFIDLSKEKKRIEREISKISKRNEKVKEYINLVCKELELKYKREQYLHPEETKEKVNQKIKELQSSK